MVTHAAVKATAASVLIQDVTDLPDKEFVMIAVEL